MRKTMNFDVMGQEDGHLEKFYGEMVDEDSYDSNLIKKMFCKREIRFSKKMLERKKF